MTTRIHEMTIRTTLRDGTIESRRLHALYVDGHRVGFYRTRQEAEAAR